MTRYTPWYALFAVVSLVLTYPVGAETASSTATESPYTDMMAVWVDAAKEATQLAVAALVLPVFFLRNILGVSEGTALGPKLNCAFYLSWILLFVSIGAGLLFQVTAADMLSSLLLDNPVTQAYPVLQFRVMMFGLYLGLVFFGVGLLISKRTP